MVQAVPRNASQALTSSHTGHTVFNIARGTLTIIQVIPRETAQTSRVKAKLAPLDAAFLTSAVNCSDICAIALSTKVVTQAKQATLHITSHLFTEERRISLETLSAYQAHTWRMTPKTFFYFTRHTCIICEHEAIFTEMASGGVTLSTAELALPATTLIEEKVRLAGIAVVVELAERAFRDIACCFSTSRGG